jgi:hypothetical protein
VLVMASLTVQESAAEEEPTRAPRGEPIIEPRGFQDTINWIWIIARQLDRMPSGWTTTTTVYHLFEPTEEAIRNIRLTPRNDRGE